MTRHFRLPALTRLALLFSLLLGAAAAPALEQHPDFAMADLDGKVHQLADYRGRWVILNYWATWCPPCVEEIPELVAYQAAHPEQVVLGINFEVIEAERVRAFAAEAGINYPVLPTNDGPPDFAQLRGLPTTVIITPAGELIAEHVGPLTRQMLEDFIGAEQANPGNAELGER